jgi:predicted DNA binding CopG/RHH family protein
MKNKIDSKRVHIVMPVWLLESIKISASKLGISPSDYIRDILKAHQKQKADAD